MTNKHVKDSKSSARHKAEVTGDHGIGVILEKGRPTLTASPRLAAGAAGDCARYALNTWSSPKRKVTWLRPNPKSTLNTGNVRDDETVSVIKWI